MCLSISALGDDELIGSWEVDYDYMAEQGMIPEGELASYKSGENVLMEFLPDGTLNLYYGHACDYTYTEDKVTMIYTESIFFMVDFEELPTVTIEYAYTLNGDELILLTEPEEGSYLICRRKSGEEGFVGCWNVIAQLDEVCRHQQYGEGWFPTMDAVPKNAITMSCREIMRANAIVNTVPDTRKAKAVALSLEGPITNMVPATIMRNHANYFVFLDQEAASLLKGKYE